MFGKGPPQGPRCGVGAIPTPRVPARPAVCQFRDGAVTETVAEVYPEPGSFTVMAVT